MERLIIGGGISGLSLAHALGRAELQVRLWEASARGGGNVRTDSAEGFVTEAGPHGFVDHEPAMRRLIDSLGLAEKVRPADPVSKKRFVVMDGRLRAVPTSPPAFLKSDLLSWPAKLRVLAEAALPWSSPEGDPSLAHLFRAHFGDAVSPLVDALQLGLYAGDPNRLSARAAFPKLFELAVANGSIIRGQIRARKLARQNPPPGPESPTHGRLCSFAGGLGTLVEALAHALGERMETGAKVEHLAPEGDGLRVVRTDGVSAKASKVVLALPAPEAARLLREGFPALADELSGIRHAPLSVVHLGFRKEAFPNPPEGFGFLAPHREGCGVLGAIFTSSIFPERAKEGHVLVTCMVGGVRAPERAALEDEPLRRMAADALGKLLFVSETPVWSRVVRWPAAIPQYDRGHLERLARIEVHLRKHPGLFLLGNAYQGVGLNDCVRNAAELAVRLS